MNFLSELKRRNVIRMAGLYLVGAWLIVQVVGTLLPMFEAPVWVSRSIVMIVAIGFVPALIFAWVFELTPEGIKRDAEVAPEHSIAPQTARRMDRMIIVVLLLALGYFGFDKFVLAPHRDAELLASAASAAAAGKSDAATNTADPHSIAVLPFVNMSGDPANGYFSDGVSEEILNVLARTPDLHVAARTSSFSFQGRKMEIPEIALALNVRMVLEGSVRKQDDRVRITAQLIDAKTGFHVWSQTYDRKLQDIFAIQDEIAKAIGEELQVKIEAAQDGGKPAAGTENLAAYDLYLRGIALWQERREETLWQAIDLFQQATAQDPQFAQGYAGLALAYAIVGDYSGRMDYAQTLVRAKDFAERALALNPASPEAFAALAYIASRELRRPTADALFARSISLRPSFATAYQWRGSLALTSGDLEGALKLLEHATMLDPRSLVVAENHSYVLRALGRAADAKARCMKALEFAPTYAGCLGDVALADLSLGDYDSARQMFDRLAAGTNQSASTQGRDLVEALTGNGDRHALAKRYAALNFNSKVDPASGNTLQGNDIPQVLMQLGEPELALDYLEYLSGELGGSADWAVMLPALDPIRCDPRFVAVVEKAKTTDPYASKVCPGKN